MSADAPRPPPLLDWRDRRHWSDYSAPCWHCHQPTNLRDDKKKPAHKVCAERALAAEQARTLNRYQNGF